MSKCTLDGHKPLDIMSAKELDEFYCLEFGLKFEEFYKKFPPTNATYEEMMEMYEKAKLRD